MGTLIKITEFCAVENYGQQNGKKKGFNQAIVMWSGYIKEFPRVHKKALDSAGATK